MTRPAAANRASGTNLERRLLDRLRLRRDEMAELLLELLEMESPSERPETQRPILERLSGELREVGYRVRRIPGRETGGHILAVPEDRNPGAPYQLLLGHCDTVWPLGTKESMPVLREAGRIRGPGAFDMKGGLVQLLFALRVLREEGLNPDVTPVAFVNSDEERGSPESTPWIRRLARRAVRSLVLEPALGAEGCLKTFRKGVGTFTVRVTGRSAHGGLNPESGASAIREMARVVEALYALADPDRGITVNVGRIEGGVAPNVVAPHARALVDVRVASLEDARRIEEAVRSLRPSIPGTRLEMDGGVDRPPLERTPRNRRLWYAAREIARAMGLDLGEGTSGGASDGNTTSLYTATLDGLGPVGDGAHAPHEFVFVDRLPERAALLGALLLLPADLTTEPT